LIGAHYSSHDEPFLPVLFKWVTLDLVDLTLAGLADYDVLRSQ
jgi:hypothetical protein